PPALASEPAMIQARHVSCGTSRRRGTDPRIPRHPPAVLRVGCPPMATNGGAGGLSRLGAWAARRTEPRLWVTLAGAGCLLAVFGLLLVSGDAQIDDDGSAGSNAPGIVLFLLVVAAGYLLMHFFREAPAASAGVAAVVLGTPPLIWFLTFDAHDVPP